MTVAMSAVVAIFALVSVAVTAVGSLYAVRAQAQVAADAAALAAAVATYPPASSTTPLLAARDMARENGASLMRCECLRDVILETRVVEVVTVIRAEVPMFGRWMVHGSSRAEFDPVRWLGS